MVGQPVSHRPNRGPRGLAEVRVLICSGNATPHFSREPTRGVALREYYAARRVVSSLTN